MALHILVPVDGSSQSTAALEYVLTHHPDAEITALHVIDPFEFSYASDPMGDGYWEGWFEFAEEQDAAVLEDAEEIAAAHDATISTASDVGPPARTIVDYAGDHDVDHIVMGSHGRRGVSRVLLGSVAETVVRRAPIPVTVVR